MSFILQVRVTQAGHDSKGNEHFLERQHYHSSRFFPVSSANYATPLPHYNLYRDGARSDPLDGNVVILSSAQLNADAGSCISVACRDPLKVPRQPESSYPRSMHRIMPQSLRQTGRREPKKFKADVMDVSATASNPRGNQQSKYEFVKDDRTFNNVEGMHYERTYPAADVVEDKDAPRIYATKSSPAQPRVRYQSPPHGPAMLDIDATPIALGQEPFQAWPLYAHGPLFRAWADDAVWGMHTTTAAQHPHSFRRHPFPIGGPNPFRQSSLRTQENPVKQPAATRHAPAAPRPSIVSPRSSEHLDDEEIIVYLNSDLAEGMSEEVRLRNHRPAVPNQKAHDRYCAERRLHSPPETRRRLDEEYIGEPEPEVGLFDNFPVCEMSIAMGLHDTCSRSN